MLKRSEFIHINLYAGTQTPPSPRPAQSENLGI